MDRQVAVNLLRQETERVAALATDDAQTAPVPTCPDWDMSELVKHLGNVYNWAGTIVAERLAGPPDREQLSARPEGVSVRDWMTDRARRSIEALESVPDDALIWNFVALTPASPAFWWRRQLHETLVHRVDAELTCGKPVSPVEPLIAADLVSEFFALRRFTIGSQAVEDPAATGTESHPLTIHLHATDVSQPAMDDEDTDGNPWSEWTIDIANNRVTNSHAKGDAGLRGPAWSLAQWVWCRGDTAALETFGDADRAEAWRREIAF